MSEPAEKPLILDFGLHEGEDTEFYLTCGADVIAFEANDALVSRNSIRFAKEVASDQLQIVAGAIVPPDFAGTELTFYLNEDKSVWGTTSPDWAERNSGLGTKFSSIKVPAIDLKAILTANPKILYAKIDIEGADRHVLDTFGVTNVRPDFVSIESDKLDINNVVGEIETLQALGYTRFAAVQQATIPFSTLRGRRFDGSGFEYRFRNHASGPFGPYLAQPYKTAGAIIDEYRSIFRAYMRFGDQSWVMQHRLTRFAAKGLNRAMLKAVRRPLCGWYDTHAAL